MRPEAVLIAKYSNSKWRAAVRKPDNPPDPSVLTGMMSLKDSTVSKSARLNAKVRVGQTANNSSSANLLHSGAMSGPHSDDAQRNLAMTGSTLVASASGDPTRAQMTTAKTSALENVHNAKRIRALSPLPTDQDQ